MKRLYIILGNGFSIDVVNRLNKEKEIDLINLFTNGDQVKWPNEENIPFLCYKHCKALWSLGARTTLNTEEAKCIIKNIVTCSNVYLRAKENFIKYRKDHLYNGSNFNKIRNVYIAAYGELIFYLRYLMITYNDKIDDLELNNVNSPLIKYIIDNKDKYEEIVIITYNYDIFLERILNVNNIEFNIQTLENNDECKIKIYKPHGSISFVYKKGLDNKNLFKINYSQIDMIKNIDSTDFKISYIYENENPKFSAIVPPYGDGVRYKMNWLEGIRKEIIKKVSESCKCDEAVFFGVSYCHEDRRELDEIISNLHNECLIKYIDPMPNISLDAVLTSLFTKYIHLKDPELLI